MGRYAYGSYFSTLLNGKIDKIFSTFFSPLKATIIYFHSTPEKFVASVVAVLLWFFSYRFLFNRRLLGVPLPGEGTFRYMNPFQPLQTMHLRRASLISKNEKTPTFKGMPHSPQKSVIEASITKSPGTPEASRPALVRQ